ncbi:conjugal transfer protein TraX [Burkholderia gladioli]|uniref:TraX family protein n=1 Tax=Burkholderia gladioli TaxID=28095 RepID=UPI0028550687|nr:TraX family protein [Burkholderia gladioli]MDR8093086.1 conjugal transfer protein TraX [Burkholderia gladioli]
MRSSNLASGVTTSALPQLVICDGTIEALKWFALVCMTGDHVDKYLLHGTITPLFDLGRLAMPIFGFVLAYNLARPRAFESGGYQRTMARLAIGGLLATPAFVALGGLLAGWWPLNIMFALLTVTATLFLWQRGHRADRLMAVAVALIGGSSVEFWWPAIGFCIAMWSYCNRPSWSALLAGIGCCAALALINGNSWALASLVLIGGASTLRLNVPRARYAFYAYYPAHLTVIWAIKTLSS